MKIEVMDTGRKTYETEAEEFDAELIAEALNERENRTVVIGNMIFDSSNISRVRVMEPENANLEVYTIDRKTVKVEMPDFDAVAVNNALNDSEYRFIVLGGMVIDRGMVARILPL